MPPHRFATIALVLAISSCAKLPAEEMGWEYWEAELSRGYADDEKQPLLDFLNDWHERSKPISPELLKKKPAFEKAVYDLYRAFFKPAKRHYKDTQFIVIQNKINVYIVDSDLRRVFDAKSWDHTSSVRDLPEISHLMCKDFRPRIELEGKKLLYLENDRLAATLGFLTEDDDGYRMIDRYRDEDCEAEERKKKLRYLNSAMEIFPGHWGVGWHFETHPYINSLYFSSDFKKAVVIFRVYYGGGEALMSRQDDGDWKIVLMQDTWIE
jgi:hypothetical protein